MEHKVTLKYNCRTYYWEANVQFDSKCIKKVPIKGHTAIGSTAVGALEVLVKRMKNVLVETNAQGTAIRYDQKEKCENPYNEKVENFKKQWENAVWKTPTQPSVRTKEQVREDRIKELTEGIVNAINSRQNVNTMWVAERNDLLREIENGKIGSFGFLYDRSYYGFPPIHNWK